MVWIWNQVNNLPHGSFAKTVLAKGVGSEEPIFETAFTRNLYSFLVVKSVTSKTKGAPTLTSPEFCHPPNHTQKKLNIK